MKPNALRPRDYAVLAAIGMGLWLVMLMPTNLLIVLVFLSILVGLFFIRLFIG